MNHDCCHCLDYDEAECPETCFRARLTKEYNECCVDFEGTPVTWANLRNNTLCPLNKPKRTNGDCIRAMTDEELTDFLCNNTSCGHCIASELCWVGHTGFDYWIKQEAKDD